MPVSWGIQLSRMHGNIRKASFAVRVIVLVDVPKASLRDWTTAGLWAVPAGREMPLEWEVFPASPQMG